MPLKDYENMTPSEEFTAYKARQIAENVLRPVRLDDAIKVIRAAAHRGETSAHFFSVDNSLLSHTCIEQLKEMDYKITTVKQGDKVTEMVVSW